MVRIARLHDEDGLYTDDPKKNPTAKFLPKVTAQELLRMDPNDLVIERVVLEYRQPAAHLREVQVMNGLKPFKCPNGFDPTTGQAYQCSYAMNYVNGGPNGKTLVELTNGNGSSNILIVWDHGKTTGCADSSHAATPANPRGPWPFPDSTNPRTHYPDERHTNVFNVLYCDGHAGSMAENDLTAAGVSLFLANGSVPTYP
jgi:prepilin-type processing-associated H-X9-DG protein